MLCLTAGSSSCMRFSEGVTFSIPQRSGMFSGLTHSNPMRMGICAGAGKPITGAPKILSIRAGQLELVREVMPDRCRRVTGSTPKHIGLVKYILLLTYYYD